MIKTILIDDEKNAIIGLKMLLNKYCKQISVVATASSAKEGKEVIELHNPDLIFLDISMPDGDGFSLLKNFKNPNFYIVFVTAYNDYAIKAFEFSALHYILKPINYRLLQDVEERILNNNKVNTQENSLKVLSENLNHENKKLVLSSMNVSEVVDTDDIIYIESVNNYLVFYLNNSKSIIITKQLSLYEKLLEGCNFFRIHHSHLINLKYIEKYIKGRGGKVIMTNGKILEVSTRRKHDFLVCFNEFHH